MRSLPKIPGVYEIVGAGSRYVGSAGDMRRRAYEHRSKLNRSIHANHRLQALWDFYGEEAFQFNVLVVCERKDVLHFENIFIENTECDLNINLCAWGSAGIIRSDDFRKRIGDIRRGTTHSESAKRAISRGLTGRPVSAETRAKQAAQKGWKHSDEARAKMRAAKAAQKAANP